MTKDLNTPSKKEKTKSKLIVRLMIPMLILVLLQLVTFFAILTVGGEFSYVRRYAYNTLIEKTENRRNYIQSELQQKIPNVRETSEKINALIEDILEEKGASIINLQTDKELNRLIMASSVDTLVSLLRSCRTNGVYLILETGDLYSGTDGRDAKVALYLRDLDPTTDAGYEDLLMEMGFSSISQDFGIVLDSGWSLHFEADPDDMDNFDYYYKTIQTALENPSLSTVSLGYWSGFTKPSRSATASMKYTVPLIARDGTVYGVLGIELTENTVLASIPTNDFIGTNACYVLSRRKGNDLFDIITHSGTAFNRFFGDEKTLQVSEMLDENIWDFSSGSEVELAGTVQYMNLYNQDSPYYGERWALISVADRASILKPLTNLVRMLFIAAVASLTVSIVVIILSCRQVVKPISNTIKTMNANQQYSQIVRFLPSNIYEIDKMTDAITQLQINVQDFSSQVSQMMRIANMGLGIFMYDHTDDSVFVGQSLLKLLQFQLQQDEDVIMSRQEFLDNIVAKETKLAVTEAFAMELDEEQADHIKTYSIAQEDGSTIWMRLSLVYNKNKSIGILQDVTGEMMEKRRIEYERDYDSTTGLLNRRAYYQRVEELFRNPDELKITAFIMLDLDNLKYINDTYGHDFGDDYIKTAATSLKSFEAYGGVVARLSGDEFNVCLPGFSSKEEVTKIIKEVREQLLQSHCLLPDGTHFKIRASAGVAWYPDDAESYEMLMKYADFAMYTIKHSTKGGLAEFDVTVYEMDSVLITGVEEMNRILDEGAVKYMFQSIVSADTGEIYGYEALMRPQSTIFQSPLELLRAAKTGARLYEIERLTWTKALEDFQVQIDAGHVLGGSHIFINSISNRVLEASDVEAIEKKYPHLLSRIVLEILESERGSEECTAKKKARTKRWNAQIALDDFGAGYNSEYALITVQPNIIKIDCSIVNGCDKDPGRRTIISNLIKLAHAQQILVVAEGVQTKEELGTVISCGADLLQGDYMAAPAYEPQPLPSEIAETIRHLAAQADEG